jgi:stage V sporulation protein SpoVS
MVHIHGERQVGDTRRRLPAPAVGRAAAVLIGVALLAGCSGPSPASSTAAVTPAAKASGPASASPTSSPSTAPSTAAPSPTASSSRPSSTPAAVHPLTGGNIKQTVAPHVVPTKRAVPLDKTSPVSGKVAVSLAGVKSITVKAVGPGEVAGAALAVTVRIKNDSGHALNVSSAYVTLIDSAGNVGTPTPVAPSRPLIASIASGTTAEGVYVFTVAKTARNPVDVMVTYSTDAPAARFVGNAA